MGSFWLEWDPLLRWWLPTWRPWRGMEAIRPSTRTHDLQALELRSEGRGQGRARAINVVRGMGDSDYPAAAAVPVRERWQGTRGLSGCQYLPLLSLSPCIPL